MTQIVENIVALNGHAAITLGPDQDAGLVGCKDIIPDIALGKVGDYAVDIFLEKGIVYLNRKEYSVS